MIAIEIVALVVLFIATLVVVPRFDKRLKQEELDNEAGKLLDTSALQLESLKSFMKSCGYYMVETDCNVFFRTDGDSYTAKSKRIVSFQTAVAWHNDFFANPAYKLVEDVKLQRSGGNVIVQSHKVKPLPHCLVNALKICLSSANGKPIDYT